MPSPIYLGPTATTLTLRALQRYPERTAFAGDTAALSYRAARKLIGRMQAVFSARGGAVRGHEHHLAGCAREVR